MRVIPSPTGVLLLILCCAVCLGRPTRAEEAATGIGGDAAVAQLPARAPWEQADAATVSAVEDFAAKNTMTLARGAGGEVRALGRGWRVVRVHRSITLAGPDYQNLLLDPMGSVVGRGAPEFTNNLAVSIKPLGDIIAEISGEAKDMAAVVRHIDIFLQKGYPEENVLIRGVKDIPGYEKRPLDRDLELAVTAPYSFANPWHTPETHVICYSYQRVGGRVTRWRFTFYNGKLSRSEALLFNGVVGGDIMYK